MRVLFFSIFISVFSFATGAYAGEFPSCPKGTVWDGNQCVSICPDGYEWNSSGVCVKKSPDPASPAKCKKNDNFFQTAETGCRQQSTWLVFSQRSRSPMPYREAERYCARIEGGKKDWRLPNEAELTGVAGETLAGAYFDFNADHWFWSSTSYNDYIDEVRYRVYQKQVHLYTGFADYRYVKTVKGELQNWDGYDKGFVVCVRADE